MITVGNDQIESLFVGDMGIKEIVVCDEVVYTRPGGYLYIELITEEE